MKFLITAGADPSAPPKTEPAADAPFDEAVFAAYMKFNEDMARAGVLIASEGLSPASPPARIGIVDGKRRLLDGPFVESKELVGGFYLIDVPSRDDAIAWALRCPTGFGADALLTVLQLTEASDIPTPLLDIIGRVAPTWSATFTKKSQP